MNPGSEPQNPATPLPPVVTSLQPQLNPRPNPQPMAVGVPTPYEPKQMAAQFAQRAEEILSRTQASPRAQAEEIAALRAEYLDARLRNNTQDNV